MKQDQAGMYRVLFDSGFEPVVDAASRDDAERIARLYAPDADPGPAYSVCDLGEYPDPSRPSPVLHRDGTWSS